MNAIKNSFSKIKASDEFKEKLLKELQAAALDQKPSANGAINKSKVLNPSNYKEENLNTKKIYYKKYIAAAAIFCIIIGIIGSKLALTGIKKENDNSEIIAYEPQTEPATQNDHLSNNNNANGDINPKNITDTKNINNNNNNNNNNGSNLEKAEIPKSYEKNGPSLNNANKHNTKNNNETSTAADKAIVNNDAASNPDESYKKSLIQEAKDNSSNNITLADNKPKALKDEPALARSITQNANFAETASVNSIYIPKYELPEGINYSAARMMPLIIYKGNIYLHSNIIINSKDISNLLGQKLGTTKNTINEWKKQEKYPTELASNIGVMDVYSVNGYDDGFRIMTNYKSEAGTNTADLYECLNGITISNGSDILSKLNLKGNVVKANYQTYSDWNNGTNIYHSIDNIALLNDLFNEIDLGTPYLSENIENTLGDYRNDNEYKVLSLDLKDGTKNVTFTLLKSGYVSYGNLQIYFKIDSNFTENLWNKLN